MRAMRIEGGRPLSGTVQISGAKNAALPALAATLLTEGQVTLSGIPPVADIRTMARLLARIGAAVEERSDGYRVRGASEPEPTAPYDLVKTMRASSLVLGPLAGHYGRARVSLPGGCAIGARPIDMHLTGLKALGASIGQERGYIEAVAPRGGLVGGRIRFRRPTVTGTEDLLMAAVLAKGESVFENAAREPEVVDLADLLTKMGARIEGAGTRTIHVEGVPSLHGTEHRIIPDRIETGTYLVAGALTAGRLTIRGTRREHLERVIERMRAAGCRIGSPDANTLEIDGCTDLTAVDITTREHPGFPTDMQAQFMALMTQASGTSKVVETVFENRFMHVLELQRMGADIRISGNTAVIRGPAQLSGAQVMASDLRASACLVLGALAARGTTTLHRIYHLQRGYANMAEKLRAVGARVEIVDA
ncbi:MAG: UDP-N-acetylglucosamine 1-carboxyvinyltransferase [Bryobacterales bacterium]|nr:UDP-N-acetylglucosamine 1-carboxyvinyltransferase [Bryobacterales bacterium]